MRGIGHRDVRRRVKAGSERRSGVRRQALRYREACRKDKRTLLAGENVFGQREIVDEIF